LLCMVEKAITKEDIKRLRSVAKKAGIRQTCLAAGYPEDTYWNIVYGRSKNISAYNSLFDAAVDIIISEDGDHAE
jgi:hypothetical protein